MPLAKVLLMTTLIGGGSLGGSSGFHTVATGQAGGSYVVFSEAGSVEDGTKKLKIAVYARKGGELLWSRQVDGRLYLAGNGTRNLPGWGTADSVLWVTHSTGGENWTVDNSGYRLTDGGLLWNNVDVGYPLTAAQGEILFRRRQSHLAYPDLRQVGLVVKDLQTGAETRLNMQIPARTNCGDINRYSYEDAAYLEAWADSQFFYTRRKDACGVFVVRFDWHRGADQTPRLIRE